MTGIQERSQVQQGRCTKTNISLQNVAVQFQAVQAISHTHWWLSICSMVKLHAHADESEGTGRQPVELMGNIAEGINDRSWHIKRTGLCQQMLRVLEVLSWLKTLTEKIQPQQRGSSSCTNWCCMSSPSLCSSACEMSTKSPQTCDKLAWTNRSVLLVLQAMGYLIIRGAPQTGKTSILQLLGSHIHANRAKATVIFLPAHRVDIAGGETFYDGLRNYCNRDWRDISSNIGLPLLTMTEFSRARGFKSLGVKWATPIKESNVLCSYAPPSGLAISGNERIAFCRL